MTQWLALALDQVGSDLAPETRILEPLGVDVAYASSEPAERERQLASADALLLNRTRVNEQLLDAAPRCRVVATYGIGHDHIDLEHARAKGVIVTNVPDYCTGEVADHALAMLLGLVRGLGRGDAYVKAGGWGITGVGTIHRLGGQTLGLVGYGRIARAVAARARAFGLSVVAFDPLLSDRALDLQEVVLVQSVSDLLREANHVSLHAPLVPETHRIINADAIRSFKPGSFLVNTSRGELVDTQALVAALDSGVVAGAALDVFPEEPPDIDQFAGRNVILTPHSAYYSVESMLQLKESVANAIADALLGRPVANRLV